MSGAANLALALAAMIGVLAATPCAAQPAAPTAPPAEDPVPAASLQGWTLDSEDETFRAYYQPAAAKGGYARLSVRYETIGGEDEGYRSQVSVVEFDCAQGRQRFRETTYYAKNGLAELKSVDRKVSTWVYPVPFRGEDRLRLIACKAGKPRPLADFSYTPPVWPVIELRDWTEAAKFDDYRVYLRDGPGGEFVGKWLRAEYLTAYEDVASEIYLFEVDCKTSRTRVAQHSLYEGNNLGGKVVQDPKVFKWMYAEPGSYDALVLASACTTTPVARIAALGGGVRGG